MAKYLKIDYRYFRIDGVTTNSALILSYIVSLRDSKKKSFFASNAHIARVLGCSTKTVSTCMSKLKSLGLIKSWNHKHKRHISYIKENLARELEKVDEKDKINKALELQELREREENASTPVDEREEKEIATEVNQEPAASLRPIMSSIRKNLSSYDFNSTLIKQFDSYFSEASSCQMEFSLEEILPVINGTPIDILELLNYLKENEILNFNVDGNRIRINLNAKYYPKEQTL